MNLTLHRFELPTRHPFTISRGTTTVQRTLIVELEQDGIHGYGEAPEAEYYGATIDSMTGALQSARSEIESHTLEDPAVFWESIRPVLRQTTFCQCAVDTAAHDLWGKLRGEPVWKLWGLSLENIPPSDYTIGIDAIDTMVAKLEEFPDFPVYKIKLGTADDVEIVRRLREHTESPFRVDANCAWGVRETIENSTAMRDLGVEFIEQPLRPDALDGMKEVVRGAALPIVADESCQVESDVDRCAGLFQGVNIKLVKCGGLTPARRMIDRARQLEMRVMVGCFTESTVGISAIAQLLPLVDYADLDGALLLAEDVATGVAVDSGKGDSGKGDSGKVDSGKVVYPNENGCGITMTGVQ